MVCNKCTDRRKLLLTSTSIRSIGVSLVACGTLAVVTRTISRVDALAVDADTGVPWLALGLSAGHGAVLADRPVKPHRNVPVLVHLDEVGSPEAVAGPVGEEGVVTGAVVHHTGVVVHPEVDGAVGEPRRDVDVAAADAGALAVLRARRVVAVGHAADVVCAGVGASLAPQALSVADGVAAEHDQHVVGVGDAVHSAAVHLRLRAAPVGVCPGRLRGVVALPPHGEHHLRLGRLDGQARHLDRRAGEHRDRAGAAAVADTRELEAVAGASGPDAERVGDVHAAAALLAPRFHRRARDALHGG